MTEDTDLDPAAASTPQGIADPEAYEHLRVARPSPGVVLVTLDLAERRNMMSAPMTASWDAVMRELRKDREVRCVVVTGAGKAFSSGGDVSWIGSEPDASVDRLRERMIAFYRTWLRIAELEVPTIAAINGAAVGAGLAMALACDLRYAADEALLGVPFTGLGMHPGMATTYFLPQVVGLPLAREMLLAGRMLRGRQAVAAGLVNAAWPADRLLAEVLGVAESVAAKAPVATRLTKLALAGGGHSGIEAAIQWEALAQPITLATEDLQEGLQAQREKRPPRFTGR